MIHIPHPKLNSDGLRILSAEHLILRCDVGSRGLGISGPESDHDHKGVAIEPLSMHVGLGKAFEQLGPIQYKAGEHGAYPTGLDLEVYSLKKFVFLAMGGNPNILSILFHPEPLFINEAGRALQGLAPKILSRNASYSFLGYMQGQKERLMSRGRQKYVDLYGFDTKFAAHLLRVGFQGIELLESGTISMPVPEPHREFLINVREGKVALDECLKIATELEARLKDLKDTTELPLSPDKAYCDVWVRSMYWEHWNGTLGKELLLKRKDLGFGTPTVH